MNKLTFYEQVGIVIPGSVFLFGLLLFFPVLQVVLTKDGVSVGELGIFVLLSYAAGHLIAAVGNAAESFLWGLVGGMPSGWVTKTQTSLLSGPQIDLLEKKVQSRWARYAVSTPKSGGRFRGKSMQTLRKMGRRRG